MRRHRVIRSLGGLLDAIGFVLGQNLAFAFEQQRDQRVETGSQARDLAGIQMHGARQLLFRQLPPAAEHQHVFKGGRDQIRRRLSRTRESLGIVLLVRVNDPADPHVFGHE